MISSDTYMKNLLDFDLFSMPLEIEADKKSEVSLAAQLEKRKKYRRFLQNKKIFNENKALQKKMMAIYSKNPVDKLASCKKVQSNDDLIGGEQLANPTIKVMEDLRERSKNRRRMQQKSLT